MEIMAILEESEYEIAGLKPHEAKYKKDFFDK
jgi:hypothetical protein